MATYILSHPAYAKILLHAAKYPHAPVNGVLIGKKSNGSNSIVIEDAVPLLHMWTSLSPMMEIGLDLAGTHAEALGLQLLGYYQATERLDDTALAPVGERVVSKIKEKFSDAIALVVDGEKIGSGEAALIPYLPAGSSNTWRPQPANSNFSLANAKSPLRVLSLIREQSLHEKIGDFDDHLEDVSIDWLKNAACADKDFNA
ncbi:hypothetical protein M422DRAFT_69277 [Sphaerobolus stellatus SS14]|uniref:MPN domain-containing protein n=1 Tax=Sphaerobolus stellatus (strain SS14) TaxID=990650 RepID=A0A0C9V7N2_SPHS4|nr:hypothetical protein M422DRAFT_69277 [Sphaerobolus stellatus SS14]